MSKQIFISYSTQDKRRVKKIKNDIEEAGYRVWIYPKEIEPGDRIINEEEKGIKVSDFMLFMRSVNSEKSKPAQEEISLAKKEEKLTGKKKLLIVNIDKNLPLRNNQAIQICDLSNDKTYAIELHKLLLKLKEHTNYSLKQIVTRGKGQNKRWFKVKLELTGADLNFVSEVDYHLHPDIAISRSTIDDSDDFNKNFSISFYTIVPEVVFAVVSLNDDSIEEIRHFVTLSNNK